MISPYVDLTGKLSLPEVQRQTLESVDVELLMAEQKARLLSGMNLASYGDVESHPGVVGGTTRLASVRHGLGYSPQFFVYFKNVFNNGSQDITQYMKLPLNLTGSDGGVTSETLRRKIGYSLKASADSQNLYIDLIFGFIQSASEPIGGWIFRYYIFKQPQV